ncbi:hypothetical protein ACFVSW_27555, partial [Neobacillus sp. NPDC058068]|uniref:hypothetical protein n=1 Tax=Neobacillus sp. NPDC058068 TaxID=3346325 RepID=UPI0036DE29CB
SPVPLLPQESRAFHSNQHCAQNQQCALTQPFLKIFIRKKLRRNRIICFNSYKKKFFSGRY